MKIPVTTSHSKISMYGNSVAHGRNKQLAELKRSETVNNSIEKRPALATRPSGSERFNKGNNQPSFTGDARMTTTKIITNIAKEALTGCEEKIPEWTQKMGGANWFDKTLHSVNKNETFYEAFIALFVAGLMKPAFVLMMPGAEKEDKQMAATKNSVSALLGFGLSNLILSPCSEAVNKITGSFNSKNPTQYIKDLDYINLLKNEEVLQGHKSTLGEAFKCTYKKIWDLGVSPLKASMTIALTPIILKMIFGKDKNKKKEQKIEEISLQNSTVFNAIRAQKNISGANKVSFAGNNEKSNDVSFKGNIKDTQAQPSFTGLNPNRILYTAENAISGAETGLIKKGLGSLNPMDGLKSIGRGISTLKAKYCDIISEPIAKGMGAISNTKTARKIVEGTAHFEKPSPRWSDLTSIAITFFYISNTYKSDKMDEDRKLPLMINNAMVTAASSGAAFLIDKYTDKPMENLLRGYITKHGDNIMETSKKNIINSLDNALRMGKENFDLEQMTHHSEELLSDGIEKLTDSAKQAIKELTANETVQKAIKEKLIENDDIAKMAVSGFEKQASKIFKNISKAKSLTIFTITVRFLVTVLMTPIIGRVVALVNKKLGKTKQEEKKPEHLTLKVQNPETLGIKDFMSMVKK